MVKAIKNWFGNFFKSEEEVYLSHAVDIIDLENRLRSIEHKRYMTRVGGYDIRYLF